MKNIILATALLLALTIVPALAKGTTDYATECVTVERTYQDGTSEINRYGVCPSLADVLADYPTIGGQPIPWALHCAEDEGIMYMGVPDTLVCQTIDDLVPEPYEHCAKVAQWTRNALLFMASDPDEMDIARDKVRDLVTGVALALEPCARTGD